ncbi:lipoprotein insertase outer membrane protein LolB [Aliivibrio salmonicida]|uniref:lipoprotein insertase outer membrane protein LolB n=1 Tax=Aliivibrio salmonicida TaxID=40269 RepID=UPI003D110D15
MSSLFMLRRPLSFFASVFFLLFFLSACSTTPLTPQQSINWNKHQSNIEQLTQYKVTGKIGYQDPEQRHSLNFQWTQKEDNSQLLLTTFLGQTIMKLTLSKNKATIETGDGKKFEGNDPGRLLYGLTGMTIPIAYLSDWLKGLPTSADAFELNELNTVEHLSKQISQTNWHLRYNSYIETNGLLLPNSMKLTQKDTAIKIIASNWIISQ